MGYCPLPAIADIRLLTIVDDMWRSLAVAPLVAAAACHSGPPSDCNVALKQGIQCMGRAAGHDREALLACFPFSKPERMSGAWIYGFEANAFYEGGQASTEYLKRYSVPPSGSHWFGNTPDLVFNPNLPVDRRLRVFQIDFVGRRGKCPIGSHGQIVVDRVLASTLRGVTG